MAEGYVHCHLVTVEIGVERRSYQGVQLDGLSFYQLGLEGLDGQTVQRWRTVEQHRVPFQYIFQDIPDHRLFFVYQFTGRLHGFHDTSFNEFANDEWLE